MQIVGNLCLVGWSYRRWPMRRLFEDAADLGFATVEVRPCADAQVTSVEAIVAALDKARGLAAELGPRLPVMYLHNYVVADDIAVEKRNPTFFSPEVLGRLVDSGVELVHLLVERVRPNGSHVRSSIEAEEHDFFACREALEILAETLEPYGLRAAVEVRPGTIADTFEGALWTYGHLDHDGIGMSVDFANLLLTDRHLDLAGAVRAAGDRIAYTHLKNLKHYPWGHDWDLALQQGCIDYFEVLAALRHVGYDGLFGVEFCGAGDVTSFIRRDRAYLEDLEARLAREDRWQPRWTDNQGLA